MEDPADGRLKFVFSGGTCWPLRSPTDGFNRGMSDMVAVRPLMFYHRAMTNPTWTWPMGNTRFI